MLFKWLYQRSEDPEYYPRSHLTRTPRSLHPGKLRPEQLRTRNAFFTETDHDHVLAVFLAQQCYHAQIAVLRSVIIFPEAVVTAEVQKRAADVPEIKCLLSGTSVCVTAARSLVMQTLPLADTGVQSTLLGAPLTFLASVVLALGILRAPTAMMAPLDLELLASATKYVESLYQYLGFHPDYVAILPRLRERVAAVQKQDVSCRPLLRRERKAENGAMIGAEGDVSSTKHVPIDGRVTSAPHQEVLPAHGSLVQDDGPQFTASQQHLENVGIGAPAELEMDMFTGLGFDELWNMVDADWFMYGGEDLRVQSETT